MTVMRRIYAALGTVGAVAACVLIALFLLRQHDIDKAGAWASVIGLAPAVLGLWLTVRTGQTGGPSASAQQSNEAKDHATMFIVQDGTQTIYQSGPILQAPGRDDRHEPSES